MQSSSRRSFLAVTGAVAAGATVLPTSLAGAQQRPDLDPVAADLDPAFGAPLAEAVLMACVTDLAAGEVTVINGSTEVTVADPTLAERIALLGRKEA